MRLSVVEFGPQLFIDVRERVEPDIGQDEARIVACHSIRNREAFHPRRFSREHAIQ